jgi:UDP-GlcNAc:undecaprenyl-phosphate GlcNAc-1-phosphate transferase
VPEELRLAGAFALALVTTLAATPISIRIARRTQFYDRPVGYKAHGAPTPLLGGAAVVCGMLAGGWIAGGALSRYAIVFAAVLAMLVVGTIDDRKGLSVSPRVLTTIGCGSLLFAAGLGWEPFPDQSLNFLMTILFVVGVVCGYNIMDNLDGAISTVASVTGLVIGFYAAAEGAPLVSALAFGLAGACIGFLPFNLSRPAARIFLGDGGSMPIGLTVAVLIMNLPQPSGFDWELVAVTLVLVGLPGLDTALVIISRLRRGVPVLSGGRDHITHRILAKTGSTNSVAVALAGGQAFFSILAIILLGLEAEPAFAGAGASVILALGLIAALEASSWTGTLTRKHASARASVASHDSV